MDCLKGYIGILGCAAPAETPGSGLYINQLPGVSLEVIEGIADDEQETYLGVWADVEMRGLLKFALAVKAELNKCYRTTDKEVVACLICGSKDLFAVALWYLLGCELMIERSSSTRLNRFTTIDREDAEKLKVEFFTEFQAALIDAVASIDPTDNDCVEGCAESNADIRFVESTP
jgi:hypothetical protein